MQLNWRKTSLFFVLWMLRCNQCNAKASGSIIPLYICPKTSDGGNAWQKLYDAYNSYPIKTWAIINVDSGPGGAQGNTDYVDAIQKLQDIGIGTLGYVRTNYTKEDQTTVTGQIDRWKQLYNPDGIFFDEMSNDDDDQKVQYYQTVGSYAKTQQGFTFTVGNPGTATAPRYFDTVDAIVISEQGTGFPSTDQICAQDTNTKGRNSVAILSYNIKDLDTAAVSKMKACAGYIYVTDDSGSNPWDTLPNYLTQLFEVLQG